MNVSDQGYDFSIAYWNLAVHYPFSGVIQWRKGASCWTVQTELPLAPKQLLTVNKLLY